MYRRETRNTNLCFGLGSRFINTQNADKLSQSSWRKVSALLYSVLFLFFFYFFIFCCCMQELHERSSLYSGPSGSIQGIHVYYHYYHCHCLFHRCPLSVVCCLLSVVLMKEACLYFQVFPQESLFLVRERERRRVTSSTR